ncbi:MAG: VOC family protein [Candidatus Doudnabacteria bacterium]
MLSNAKVTAVLPAADLERARKFYTEKLDLKEDAPMPGGASFKCGGGTEIFLYQRPPVTVEHTQASFQVDDLDAEMKELRARGVVFEEYDMPEMKTVNGVAIMDKWKSAWFKDSEGNILALGQTVK